MVKATSGSKPMNFGLKIDAKTENDAMLGNEDVSGIVISSTPTHLRNNISYISNLPVYAQCALL
jgi:hypothetical protein